ncbi:MAG: 50S ribosomal protein L4 [Candidatus Liptonbacteria bacterium RIFOXYC1_FULL_36_8]|uniref:Large ribosomal subunit protein uL4 n=3 Tax=Candidatus Liptoniibacteriota TaxID=1817909 RepID=A0A1G2CPC6_9BACT|nr:MAG: 50S ribosomal protein L4 [Candidatus Liptonbacteria bacterium RIFOXYB1_FULL_36_10]OGZ04121.1 MAG: 50S ribosomal protein L4 [Candidatus Liptonbacteria bacterium RIFOXYC1_FULL_36_8]OGZ04550.1 MAG: 50S ribosomal protein L4 [Candidatus Liptonbacteria bacterium RIFOXYD1_FULL_36_11]
MEIELYNKKGEDIGKTEIPERIFDFPWRPELVHLAFLAQRANSRQNLAHAKGRGDVVGGGKKPWKQKGTGRARHGSIRSPIWIGGGVSHGPKRERDFSKKINKKDKQLAIFSVLSKKLADGEIKILDSFCFEKGKTKEATSILRAFSFKDKRKGGGILVVAAKDNKNAALAVKNIERADSLSSASLNVYDLMTNRYVFLEKEAIKEIDTHYKLVSGRKKE